MPPSLPRRSDVPSADRWDVESVFPTEAAFEEALRAAERSIGLLNRFKGSLAEAGELRDALRERDRVAVEVDRLALYASMHAATDATEQGNLARVDRTTDLVSKFGAAVAYIEPELTGLPDGTMSSFVRTTPELRVYQHYFDKLRLVRDHIRSAEVEEVLAAAAPLAASPGAAHRALENSDLTFASVRDEQGNEAQISPATITRLTASPLRSVRRDAWRAYSDAYLSVKNTFAATLAGGIKRDVFFARARGYASAREATMLPKNIPTSVFDNLIAVVRAHLPLWHRYWEVRRRALGAEPLEPYDLHVPLATTEETVDFSAAVELIAAGLAPLGQEYVEVARRGLTAERWVDKYANVGKRGGAFSTGVYGTRPFIMMSYQDSLLSMSTLAHELGHSMHTWLTWRHQPPIYENYSMFVAETASNFNQALLRAFLLGRTDEQATSERFRVAVIEEGMANFHRYFFTMPILAQFELEMHERVERSEAVTADVMSDTLVGLYREGYGGRVSIDEPRTGIAWAQFPHMYGNFYVYQYATGIAAANALADAVIKEGEPAARRYLEFLQAGDSLFPLDALRLAGVDMSTPEPIERAFAVLDRLIAQLEAIVGQGPLSWLPAPDC